MKGWRVKEVWSVHRYCMPTSSTTHRKMKDELARPFLASMQMPLNFCVLFILFKFRLMKSTSTISPDLGRANC